MIHDNNSKDQAFITTRRFSEKYIILHPIKDTINFDLSIHKRLEGIQSHDIQALFIDYFRYFVFQEQNKVQAMTIIPQSVAVSLPIDVAKCDVTAYEVV